MKKTNNLNIIQPILAIGFLIIALSIGYYLVFFIPQKEMFKLQLQKQEQINKEKMIPSPTLFLTPTIGASGNIIKKWESFDFEKLKPFKEAARKAGYTESQIDEFIFLKEAEKNLSAEEYAKIKLEVIKSKPVIINNNSIHCTSYNIGDTTYTNCY
ncbi:MAG: hypothetical protein Q7U68_03820 [Candidatus Roizmanbacteria bacterium]|nr:hypothetical protein [Candidatus Roizmanbacteria bacterium]